MNSVKLTKTVERKTSKPNSRRSNPNRVKTKSSAESEISAKLKTVERTSRCLEMTDTDRNLIVQNCLQSAEDRIVITHGTDTMTETAAAVAGAVTGKTVVLTGAMIPYAFGSSDGLFNLGSALSFVQALPPGVYIAIHGQCFPWDRVRKNRERGEFEEIPQG